MILEDESLANHEPGAADASRDLLRRAADEAGNLAAVARKTGISRRRLDYLLAGTRPLRKGEALALRALIARRL